MLEQTISLVDERFAAAIVDHESPLDRLYAAAINRAAEFEGPDSLSNRFAFVLLELNDPDFQALAAQSGRRAMAAFRKMVEDAVEAGELTEGLFDPQHLAETIYAVVIGSMVMWAMMRDGSSKPRTKRDLDTLLRPLRHS
jgi:hypothetical protein